MFTNSEGDACGGKLQGVDVVSALIGVRVDAGIVEVMFALTDVGESKVVDCPQPEEGVITINAISFRMDCV